VRHFTTELEQLNSKLLEMGNRVESALQRAVRSLVDQDESLVLEVLDGEHAINQMEIEIDGLATRLLALRQPVARDLRLLTAALKITTDLERIGDLTVSIAKSSRTLTLQKAALRPSPHILQMDSLVRSMLLKCLDAFLHGNTDLARSVLFADEEVDLLRDTVYLDLQDTMRREPALIPSAIALILVGRNLERIGDHATNIAEDVVFLIAGMDVRHRAKLA